MRRVSCSILALALLAFMMPANGSAQTTNKEGFWLTFGGGAGLFQISAEGETSDAEWSYSGQLGIGGTVGNNLQMGGYLQGWSKELETGTVQNGALLFVVNWFVSPNNGFYIRAGAGVSAYTEDYSGSDFTSLAGAGLAGLGYDFALNESFALGLYATGLYTPLEGELMIDGTGTDVNVKQRWLQIGAQLSVY